jgi:Terminase small subunit
MEQASSNAVTIRGQNDPALPMLTEKQELFVAYYLGQCYGNATEAAALAGYQGSRATLCQVGYENLRKPEIVAHLRARLDSIVHDQTAVLMETWRVASAPMNQFMVVTKPATYDEDGTKLDDMHVRLDYTSKTRALELLMRYNRMLEDKAPVEVTVKALVGVDVSLI